MSKRRKSGTHETEKETGSSDKKRWACVILAAGYGTRLADDFAAEAAAGRAMGALQGLPKALLPVGGVPLLDHWLYLFRHKTQGVVDTVLVITNEVFFLQLSEWALERGIPDANVVSNGTCSNDSRLGACADLALLLEKHRNVTQDRNILVLASDLVFTTDGFDLDAFLSNSSRAFQRDQSNESCARGACLYYTVPDADVQRRGILEVDSHTNLVTNFPREPAAFSRLVADVDANTNLVTSFLEKPQLSETSAKTDAKGAASSRKACPPLYAFPPEVLLEELREFVASQTAAGADMLTTKADSTSSPRELVAKLDAPGKFISWLVARGVHLVAQAVSGRFDIGNLAQYSEALDYFAERLALASGALPASVVSSCPARIGLAGNPSDGFGGKVLATTIANFAATVTICAHPAAEPSDAVVLLPHALFDGVSHARGLEELAAQVEAYGYYGGARLLRAACRKFSVLLRRAALPSSAVVRRGFRMSYDSTIPRSMGLAGSSALVTAALRALLLFHRVSLADLGLEEAALPKLAWQVEEEELGIRAGLMDRLVQHAGGLLLMDFAAAYLEAPYYSGKATRVRLELLPPLYLAYSLSSAGESGRVHAPVRRRFESRDPEVVKGIESLANLAEEAAEAVKRGDFGALAKVFKENFALRRLLYGDDAVGPRNIRALQVLEAEFNLAGKSAGSGGAYVCMRAEAPWMLEPRELEAVAHRMRVLGFEFVPIVLPAEPSDVV